MWIVVADDHVLLRELLMMELAAFDGLTTRVTEAGRYADLLALSEVQPPPDLILLDLVMPDGDGPQALQLVLDAFPRTKVVIISGYVNPLVAQRCLSLGAKGFIPKTASKATLYNVLRLIVNGGSYVPSFMVERKIKAYVSVAQRTDILLTTQEQRIAQHLIGGAGNREIAETLRIQPTTLKRHLYHIYKKIAVRNRSEAVAKLVHLVAAP